MKMRYMILAVGILSVIVGMMYMPIFPWYVLGGETEAEITLWGIWSMIGGFITIGGFLLLYIKCALAYLRPDFFELARKTTFKFRPSRGI